MTHPTLQRLAAETAALERDGLDKHERVITTPQDAVIRVDDGPEVINLCANNYLGLASHPDVRAAVHASIDREGYGMASVRFICGTHAIHKALEARVSRFLGTDDTILYGSCFDANGGLFETLLDEQDVVISDSLNHASIIDGIRLCKATRLRYATGDMTDLARRLEEARGARTILIATDGVFSMDGVAAPLEAICDLAARHQALVMVDDSHGVGVLGATGRGTHEHCGVMGRVDILTGTFGKALGGGSGGYTSGRREIVAWLRQRSRPYLFSNSIPPVVAAATLRVLDLIEADSTLRDRLADNARYFRARMTALGFRMPPGSHPIVPVLLGDAQLAVRMASRLLDEGVYVIGFSFPVVPKGQARIRTQLSAAHTPAHIERAVDAFARVGRELAILA